MMYTGHKMVCTCGDGVVTLVLLIYTGTVVCLAEKWAVPVGVVLGILAVAVVVAALFVLYKKNKL